MKGKNNNKKQSSPIRYDSIQISNSLEYLLLRIGQNVIIVKLSEIDNLRESKSQTQEAG